MLDVQLIANYFIAKPDLEAGDLMTHLKLQKLLYYAQGWHLTLQGTPLFPDRIEAWAHGPVVPVVCKRFKAYRAAKPLPVQDEVGDAPELSDDQQSILDEVWDVYGGYTAKALEDLTHKETPWLHARGNLGSAARCNEEMTQDAMKTFFKSVI